MLKERTFKISRGKMSFSDDAATKISLIQSDDWQPEQNYGEFTSSYATATLKM